MFYDCVSRFTLAGLACWSLLTSGCASKRTPSDAIGTRLLEEALIIDPEKIESAARTQEQIAEALRPVAEDLQHAIEEQLKLTGGIERSLMTLATRGKMTDGSRREWFEIDVQWHPGGPYKIDRGDAVRFTVFIGIGPCGAMSHYATTWITQAQSESPGREVPLAQAWLNTATSQVDWYEHLLANPYIASEQRTNLEKSAHFFHHGIERVSNAQALVQAIVDRPEWTQRSEAAVFAPMFSDMKSK